LQVLAFLAFEHIFIQHIHKYIVNFLTDDVGTSCENTDEAQMGADMVLAGYPLLSNTLWGFDEFILRPVFNN